MIRYLENRGCVLKGTTRKITSQKGTQFNNVQIRLYWIY